MNNSKYPQNPGGEAKLPEENPPAGELTAENAPLPDVVPAENLAPENASPETAEVAPQSYENSDQAAAEANAQTGVAGEAAPPPVGEVHAEAAALPEEREEAPLHSIDAYKEELKTRASAVPIGHAGAIEKAVMYLRHTNQAMQMEAPLATVEHLTDNIVADHNAETVQIEAEVAAARNQPKELLN